MILKSRSLFLLLVCAALSMVADASVASSPTYYDVAAGVGVEEQQELQQQQQANTGVNNNETPKQSYAKRRRIKGELAKRRTLTNPEPPQWDALKKASSDVDDEELDQFLRNLQFSVPVCNVLRLVIPGQHYLGEHGTSSFYLQYVFLYDL